MSLNLGYLGFAIGVSVVAVLPAPWFEILRNRYGSPYMMQSVYYKGSDPSDKPTNPDTFIDPLTPRILKRLKQMDVRDDEDVKQARDRHDDMLLEIERKEIEWVNKQSQTPPQEENAQQEEYEAAKRVEALRSKKK